MRGIAGERHAVEMCVQQRIDFGGEVDVAADFVDRDNTDPIELRAKEFELNYVKLHGEVGPLAG